MTKCLLSLTLPKGDHIFWVNYKKIERADVSGQNRTVLVTETKQCLALTPTETHLYYSVVDTG